MSIGKLLYPESIAIVGASDRIGPGFNAWNALKAVGYEGTVHFVNPKRDTLFDRPCYPSIADLPGEIDAAFVAVPAAQVLTVAAQAADKGAGGVTIMASGFGEAGEDGETAQAELSALARQRGLSVCGPNCLGFLNFSGRTALFGTSLPDAPQKGNVAAIVQSGSIGIALLNSARGLGFSHLITSGNEAVTTAADYVERLIDDPDVGVIVVFVEQLRQPRRFVEQVQRAGSAGKPVIVLKSGRSEKGQSAVLAHTGAVAGDIEVFDAALKQAGAIQVSSLDDLIETALVFSSLKDPLKADGAAMLSLSGGEIALALDAGDRAGINFPPVNAAREKLTELLPAYSYIANPLDLTWVGLYDPTVARQCARALGEQDEVGLLVLLQDAPSGLGEQQAARYAGLLDHVAQGAADAAVPIVALSNVSGALHPDYARIAEHRGVVSVRGTDEGIAAIARRLAWSNRKAVEVPAAISAISIAAARQVLDSLPAGQRVVDEYRSRRVLEAYGIAGIEEDLATDADTAAAIARHIGFPVVLKALVPGTVHKTELGLVRLALMSEDEVRQAGADLLRRGRDASPDGQVELLVQRMEKPISELLVGARVDPEFGPVIVVGGGGTNVELFKDVAIRLAPVSVATALAMLHETRSVKTLQGWRGKPEADLDAIAQVVSALSHFISDFGSEISEVEINPLAALAKGSGCRALDCVIARAP